MTDEERRCAVGRKIAFEGTGKLAKLNWTKPCKTAVGREGLFIIGLGAFDLCEEHAAAILPAIEEVRNQRLAAENGAGGTARDDTTFTQSGPGSAPPAAS